MTTFNSAFDWDTNLPPSISSLDENDFLLLLQKQFPAVSADPVPPSMLSKGMGANTQPLTKFSLPNTTSPASSDSSPSPPSANDDGSAHGSPDDNRKSSKRESSVDDEHHKRKASADDFDDELGGQPSAKSQHTDSKSKKSANGRRKSGGGERAQDESRLLKRKEQNRAAQRAFRERKEKHVKDLEDKVAQLEAKTETQATENEHLRDMLSRLQNENVVLKQTAFTFSVPSTSNTATSDGSRASPTTPSESLNLFAGNSSVPAASSVPASGGSSVTSASTHDSPSSLLDGFESFSGFSSKPDAPVASSSSTVNSTTAASDTIAFFGSPGPFTTISSNPMFTSYRDPMQSMSAFASFGGWDGDVTMAGPSSVSAESANTGLEELFGDQFSGLIPFSNGDFLDGQGSPSGSSGTNALSPIGHNKSVSLPGSKVHSSETCPKTKEDIERMVATGEKSTFGTPPRVGEDVANGSPSSASDSPVADYDTAIQQAFGKIPEKKHSADNYNIDELCLEMQRKAKCSYAAATGTQ